MCYFIKEGKKDLKPHVITRLDRDTSGLVLVGKNAVAHARFSKIGKERFIKKYHAIVHGNFENDELTGLVDEPIGKIDSGVKRGVIPDGKSAQTEYKVLKQVSGASLVELRLLTGRTHQIRVHMAYLGHPLYGDQLYGIKDPVDYIIDLSAFDETIRSFFLQIKPDVVHVHSLMGLPIEVLQIAKQMGIKTVFTSHDYFGLCPKVNFINSHGVLCSDIDDDKCSICNACAWPRWMLWIRNSKLMILLKKFKR